MQELAVYEVKARLSELLVEVEKGEQFTIPRRGVPVARLVSVAPAAARRAQASTQRQKVADAFEALSRLRADASLDIPLRAAIEQGRD